jgi:hypothetical protein
MSFLKRMFPKEKYQYGTLDGVPSDTIRLLELRPGGSKAELCGRLVTARLDDKPSYQALPYTWGDI